MTAFGCRGFTLPQGSQQETRLAQVHIGASGSDVSAFHCSERGGLHDRVALHQQVLVDRPGYWSRHPGVACLTKAAAAAEAHDTKVRAEGVYAAWMHGWKDQPSPDGMDQPTMDEAIAFARALSAPAQGETP